jgi:hypothetical protein
MRTPSGVASDLTPVESDGALEGEARFLVEPA